MYCLVKGKEGLTTVPIASLAEALLLYRAFFFELHNSKIIIKSMEEGLNAKSK
jgi:hypothetical protein